MTAGYENAPATKLLATNCSCCRRPLLDAVSVDLGIGPDCRKKYGLTQGAEENRPRANELVHRCAVTDDADELAAACVELRVLGFLKLADKISERFVKIVVTEEAGRVVVDMPYSEAALPDLRAVPGRRWDPVQKCNTFPATVEAKKALWKVMRAHFPGQRGRGPQGVFVVEPLPERPVGHPERRPSLAQALETLAQANYRAEAPTDWAETAAQTQDAETAVTLANVALKMKGSAAAAIEWLRSTRALLEGESVATFGPVYDAAVRRLEPGARAEADERAMQEAEARGDREQTRREERLKAEAREAAESWMRANGADASAWSRG